MICKNACQAFAATSSTRIWLQTSCKNDSAPQGSAGGCDFLGPVDGSFRLSLKQCSHFALPGLVREIISEARIELLMVFKGSFVLGGEEVLGEDLSEGATSIKNIMFLVRFLSSISHLWRSIIEREACILFNRLRAFRGAVL